jgi:hypothetical protein
MRRRTALAGLAGLAAGLAGCRSEGDAGCRSEGDAGDDGDAGDATGDDAEGTPAAPGQGSLTPAPVPSAGRPIAMPSPTPRAACPELPTHAEVYVCSATVDPDRAGLLLAPPADAVGRDRPARFRLTNRSELRFVTGDGWWTVARRDEDGWRTVRQGTGDAARPVGPARRARPPRRPPTPAG